MRFCLYAAPSGGTALWCEETTVPVSYGVFGLLLGSVTPIPETAFDGSDRYLGVKVGSDEEMTPRRRVVSVGYAYRAEESLTAATADYALFAGNADYAAAAGDADYANSAGDADTAGYASAAGNADTVDDKHASDFANASHTHAASEITSGTIAPERILGSGFPMLTTGTYTGNGQVTQSITGVGFQPKVLFVMQHQQSTYRVWASKTDQDGLYCLIVSRTVNMYTVNSIISLDTDGFTVGDGASPGDGNYMNENGTLYTYIAYSY
jgi:hypothetical protein